jgi:signal transduction histidine kinase
MISPGRIPENIYIPLRAKADALLLPALYVFNFFTFSGWFQLSQVATKPWLLLVWLYGLAVLVPLIWRDRAPVTVFAAQCVLTAAAWPIMPHYVPVVGIPVALYAVAAHRSRKISLLALLVAFIPNELAAYIAIRIHEGIGAFIGNSVFLGLMAAAAWGAGRLTQAGQQHVQYLERERERLERERETAREAVAAERRRIARELHDIVSHAVTVIVLQAAGAARVAPAACSQVTQSLGHIQAMGTQAMAELRRLLGVLQVSDAASPAVGLGELGPQPGLADLPVLLGSLRSTGMLVTVNEEGTPGDLDPSVDLAAYRIVQEGLTNVLKHAGKDANPRLRLAWETHSLVIQIDNNTNPAEAHRGQELSNRRGLMGLRERAHAAGGHLDAGPTEDQGGYRLSATLPTTDTARKQGTNETRSTSRRDERSTSLQR